MQHAITVSDLLWWGGAVVIVLIVLGIAVAVLSAIGRGFSR